LLTEQQFNALYLDRKLKSSIFGRIKTIESRTGLVLSKEDLHQEVFLRVWQERSKYSEGDSPVEAWVFTVASHVVADHVRSELARLKRDTKWAGVAEFGVSEVSEEGVKTYEPIDETKHTPEAEYQRTQDEISGLSSPGVEQLPTELRDVLRLRVEGLTHKEIAERLGISVSLAQKRLERAKRRLSN
jgi:RNA polymerase sigma factor (sigma-70 family)